MKIQSIIKHDLPASIVVFLVALPLCLGVALASGAPILSGVISGIIGGIVVGILSGSPISVSGPAAGLAAVVLSSITQLHSFDIFLLSLIIAGVLQLIAGITKVGFIANYIPTTVIKGLLAAIGIILILKQIPHAVGLDRDNEEDFSFFQSDGENTFSELLNIFSYFTPGAIIISLASLLLMIAWNKSPLKKVNYVPVSLIVVLMGVGLNALFIAYFPTLIVAKSHLVDIPKIREATDMITLPDFTAFGNYQVWTIAFTIAIIASLETLLNLEAVQNLDPEKRKASPNRELIAQGVGNTISGFLGGLPVTSVIVRSSVNIHSGAKSKISAILHGILILASVLIFSKYLNLIPLSSLAAILIVTGYKLAPLSLFKEMYKKGINQLLVFTITIVSIIFTDLLIGILIGLAFSLFRLLKSNFTNSFLLTKEKIHLGETIHLKLSHQVSFLNKATIQETLWNIPPKAKVVIDATSTDYIDDDVLEMIREFREEVSVRNEIQLNILGLKESYHQEDLIQFVDILDKETQQKMTPYEILEILKSGNQRFVSGQLEDKNFRQQISASSFGQNPVAVIVSCIDSRTSPELVFDVGIGDILSIRIAGNIINDEIIGSIELACKEIGTKLVVILGHSKCGAIALAVTNIKEGLISAVTDKIERSIEQSIEQCKCSRELILGDDQLFDQVVRNNINNSVEEVLKSSQYLSEKIKSDEIMMVSAFYDIKTGIVQFSEVG